MTPDRREVLVGGIAAAILPGVARAADAPTGRVMPIRGTRLWVDDSGPRDAPVLVYMHGGPGVGSLEFETYMKPALANRVRLISVDQRGVLRSDPIAKDAPVTVADTVADFDAIRMALKIPKWQVLGHSFGGMYALRYALAHPDRVSRLTLENPAYDAASSMRWLCASAAQLLIGMDVAAATEANRLASGTVPVDAAFIEAMGKTLGALGEHRQDLYVVQPQNRDMFSRLAKTAGLPDARWEQGQVPGMAMFRAADFYTTMMPRVADVKVPILYVRGSGDHATSPDQIAALLKAGATMKTVANAGHFIHVEEPKALADLLVT